MTGAFPLTRLIDRGAIVFLVLLGAFAIAVPVLNLMVPPGSALHVLDLSGRAVRQIRLLRRCWRCRSI